MTLDQITKQQLAELEELCARFPNTVFTLRAPTSLTTKNRQGQYRHTDVPANTTFKIVHAYIGKRGDIICCFKPQQPMSWLTAEITVADSMDLLDGFSEYIKDKLMPSEEIRKLQEQEAIKEQAQKFDDPAFASW